jgi:hypothetical protein
MKLSRGPRKHYVAKKFKNYFEPRAIRYHLPNWQTAGKMQAATGATAANACRATGFFPFDQNIFRPHDFFLASGNIDDAPVKLPALVNTSDQPSFSSPNFSPFTPGEAHRSSDISLLPSLNYE